jgi:type I restriction enzyme M protein
VEPRTYDEEEIITKEHPEQVQVLVVRYEGQAQAGEEVLPAEGSYARLYPVHHGDIVISNIAAFTEA